MSKYILFENKGVIDINSLILMGASSKRDDDNKFGFWGSGNKYAIAFLLKHNIDFKIFAGKKEVQVKKKRVSFRDKEFDRVVISGQETSITTDMGPNWEEWYILRECLQNIKDEGGDNVILSTDILSGKEGYTRFYIQHTKEIERVIDFWDTYFTFDRTDILIDNSEGKVFMKHPNNEGTVLYRNGFKVYESKGYDSQYDYSVKSIPINESRWVQNDWSARFEVIKFIAKYATFDIAKTILENMGETTFYESNFDWDMGSVKFNEEWKKVIGDRTLIVRDVAGWFREEMAGRPYYLVSMEFAKKAKLTWPDIKILGLDKSGNYYSGEDVEMTPKMEFLLKESLDFLKEADYHINYDIKVVKFENNNVLGQAFENKIMLSEKLFERGKKQIIVTIIEENEHLVSGHSDKTRDFQNHLLNLYLNEMQLRIGNFL